APVPIRVVLRVGRASSGLVVRAACGRAGLARHAGRPSRCRGARGALPFRRTACVHLAVDACVPVWLCAGGQGRRAPACRGRRSQRRRGGRRPPGKARLMALRLDTPLVSVVTPFYNADEWLEECIESVLAQTFTHYEYVLLDNCSTDGSTEIAL